jgi:hypothetical protein
MKYPCRLFLKTLFYANLSEDKESYPMRGEKTARSRGAAANLSEGKESYPMEATTAVRG